MRRFTALSTYCAVLGVTLLVGCGDRSGVKLVPATGSVTYQGGPVAGAAVTFVPQKGPVATAVTDDQGKFTLSTGTRKGVVPGKSKVSISLGDGGDMLGEEGETMSEEERMMELTRMMGQEVGRTGVRSGRSTLPAKYAKADSSGLEADVSSSGSGNNFDFNLQ